MDKFKILIFNVGYLTGLKGSVEGYLTQFYRYIRRTHKSKRKMILSLNDLLEKEKPDIAYFMEMHPSEHFMRLANGFPNYRIDNKYKEGGLLSKAPFFRKNCNVILSTRRAKLRSIYLKSGRKRLLYEVKIGGAVVILGHFALGKRARDKQFKELANIVKRENQGGKRKVIIGGDFNTRGGMNDFKFLAEELNMKVIPGEYTYPTHEPKFLLDLFLASPDVKVKSFKVLRGVDISDHLPVVLEVEV